MTLKRSDSDDGGGVSRRVQSIEVGFKILRALQDGGGPLPLREIARRSGMPPSKVHLYLVSFSRETVVYQDPDTGLYGLGPFGVQLGLAAIRQRDVVDLSRDVMGRLRDETGCAIYLSLWGERGPCIVAKADGPLQGVFGIRLGYVLSLTTTATGLVFLAYLPSSETERARAAQRGYEGTRSITKRDLDRQTAEVRAAGHASTIGRLHRNFSGISVPVFDFDGSVAAAVTLLGPSDFMQDERQEGLRDQLTAAAKEISLRMGAP